MEILNVHIYKPFVTLSEKQLYDLKKYYPEIYAWLEKTHKIEISKDFTEYDNK